MMKICERTKNRVTHRLGWICVATVCFFLGGCDFSRVGVSCTEHIKPGDMGRFVDQGNGVVLDPKTQLEWYRCAVGQRYTERGCAGSAMLMAWSEVEPYLAEINEKSGDLWRVPTGGEFVALAEAKCINPSLNPNAFPNSLIDNHWVMGEGVYDGQPCMVYTYKGTRSCRVFSEDLRPIFMVKAS